MIKNPIYLIGSNGNLSLSLQDYFGTNRVTLIDRAIYEKWVGKSGMSNLRFHISKIDSEAIFINCVGITNPNLDKILIEKYNFELSANLLETTYDSGHKYVSFGTVLEKFDKLALNNPYLNSKLKYNKHRENLGYSNSIHFQINTWYGTKKTPNFHMFLGEVYQSLKMDQIFKMSSGIQFREYHHIEDDIRIVAEYIEGEFGKVIDISHGKPIRLVDLAQYIFRYFNKVELLKVGDLDSPLVEVYSPIASKAPVFDVELFRETKIGVVEYLDKLLGNRMN